MVGLTSLEVHNSIFNVTDVKKIEFYRDVFDELSSTDIKDELELKMLHVWLYSHKNIQVTMGPFFITKKKLASERRQTMVFFILLLGYARYSFRNFESYSRSVVLLDEDDIPSSLKQCFSYFITWNNPSFLLNLRYFRGYTPHEGSWNYTRNEIWWY